MNGRRELLIGERQEGLNNNPRIKKSLVTH
jgi:hypothetical protein